MTDDEKKAAVIRAAKTILTDQLSNVITAPEALNRLHRLLDGPQAREAMADQPRRTTMLEPCVTCSRTRDDPRFRFPAHAVHPQQGKRMTYRPEIKSLAIGNR